MNAGGDADGEIYGDQKIFRNKQWDSLYSTFGAGNKLQIKLSYIEKWIFTRNKSFFIISWKLNNLL